MPILAMLIPFFGVEGSIAICEALILFMARYGQEINDLALELASGVPSPARVAETSLVDFLLQPMLKALRSQGRWTAAQFRALLKYLHGLPGSTEQKIAAVTKEIKAEEVRRLQRAGSQAARNEVAKEAQMTPGALKAHLQFLEKQYHHFVTEEAIKTWVRLTADRVLTGIVKVFDQEELRLVPAMVNGLFELMVCKRNGTFLRWVNLPAHASVANVKSALKTALDWLRHHRLTKSTAAHPGTKPKIKPPQPPSKLEHKPQGPHPPQNLGQNRRPPLWP